MTFQEIRFKHFASKDEYLNLLNSFIRKDDSYAQFPEIKEPIDDLELHIKEKFGNEESDYDVSTYFLKSDFLIPRIMSLATNHIKVFINLCDKKNLFSKVSIEGFSIRYLSYIRNLQTDYTESDFLDAELIPLLNEQMDEFEDYIKEYIKFPSESIETKIPLNWNHTEIAYFFYLLKVNNQIGDIGWADLGKIIDNSFNYFDSKEHRSIKKPTRKILNSFVKDGGIPEDSANKRLKTIFSNPDFFNK